MSDRITIRPATAADADTFLALVDALADYEKLDRPTPEARGRLVADAFGERPRISVFLGELDGRAVAYAIVLETYSSFLALPTLYLEDLFVIPEARRFGLGRAFFRALATEALRRGCGRMEWVVLDWNQLAIDFYDKLGARRMTEWYTYRLTAEQLAEVAGASTTG
ncbi:GNAT family N-acetyltransferase [Longimicrobium sp.]|uniref:GNAT family N-acetyltransferase n=1 Tax=Longimicrobium sp. TaxID=2029185 RepID=UPI002E32D510|nr:GNAT family N-acetyltransferase [Longimicrobium sp.]HEX6039699.1 GNAT family N-acetyltransferase [Longimicrobium sp.]